VVKTLFLIIVGAFRAVAAHPALRIVLEVAAVVLLSVAAGLWWGTPAVLCVVAVALLIKSAELDLRDGGRRSG